eukprot:Amastigsp_a845891_8.p7 type:complete len:104 gc:universal Amastigsp_a845891_8:1907-2218(+)
MRVRHGPVRGGPCLERRSELVSVLFGHRLARRTRVGERRTHRCREILRLLGGAENKLAVVGKGRARGEAREPGGSRASGAGNGSAQKRTREHFRRRKLSESKV